MGDAYKCIATRSAAIPSNAVRGAQCLAGLLQSPSQQGDALHKHNLTDIDKPSAVKMASELGAAAAAQPPLEEKKPEPSRLSKLEEAQLAAAEKLAAAERLKRPPDEATLSPRERVFMRHQKLAAVLSSIAGMTCEL